MVAGRWRIAAAAVVVAVVGAVGAQGSAGAAAAGPTISASVSRVVVGAAGAKPITFTAHVTDSAGVSGVTLTWRDDNRYLCHDCGSQEIYPMVLSSGTGTDGTWTVTLSPYLCSVLWSPTITVAAADGSASTGLSVLVNQNIPDTTAPGAIQASVGDPATLSVGSPDATSAVHGTPGQPVEFYSGSIDDTPTCGQLSSGIRSIVVTTHPVGSATPSVTGPLHLAFDPSHWAGLHWAGKLTLPANAPAGDWVYSAVVTDNAGNSATLLPYFAGPGTYPVG
jgi:hypothetical protein